MHMRDIKCLVGVRGRCIPKIKIKAFKKNLDNQAFRHHSRKNTATYLLVPFSVTDAIGDNLGVATDVDVDVVAAANSSVRDVIASDVGESTFTFLSIPFSPPLTFSTGVI